MPDYSDWEIVQPNQSILPQNMNAGAGKYSGWELVQSTEPQQSESFGRALLNAPGRLWQDISSAAMNAYNELPDYIEKAKTEIPGYLVNEPMHPLHFAKQGLAGSQELINKLAQLPLNVSRYGTERLHLVPKQVTSFMEKITPQDTQQAINQLFGEPQYPGEAMFRGAVRNIPELAIAGKAASFLNPAKLTHENMIKNVLETRSKNIERYSGSQGLYINLFQNARDQGYGKIKYNPSKLDINEIEEYANPKYTENLKKLIDSHDIEDAHWAQSDLNKYITHMDSKKSLTGPEQKSLAAAKTAEKHIKDMMFKKQNIPNEILKNEYNKITKGYAEEVIPYKIKPIQEYLGRKKTAPELVNALKKGEFAAKRGAEHPELYRREKLKNLMIYGGLLGGILEYPKIAEFIKQHL